MRSALVEMHRGTVGVSSAVGRGTEFVVRLPAVAAPDRLSPATAQEIPEPIGTRLRVLVVDDNADTVETLSMLLELSGHDVRTAYTGPKALEATLEYRPDVVLLDIGLPGLDGYEVAKLIRRQPVLDNIVLVAMTGYAREKDCRLSQESGFDHHLIKPADFEKVRQILATFSGKARTQ